VPLNLNARISIQLLHRIGALLTVLSVGWFAFLAWRYGKNHVIRALSLLTLSLLLTQIALGISNVLLLLPLKIAVAHNCMASLLLLSVITLFYYLNTSTLLYQRE
jgi:cytochrome c oxidase assembly protein subunit 15